MDLVPTGPQTLNLPFPPAERRAEPSCQQDIWNAYDMVRMQMRDEKGHQYAPMEFSIATNAE